MPKTVNANANAELPAPACAEAHALAQRLDCSVTLADALLKLGVGDDERSQKWLDPRLAHLTPPDGMAGREAACDRLAHAVRTHERIVVFGDYDCDGITATAIMTEGLRMLGGDATPLLASRFDGGYGFSDAALVKVLDQKPDVLVTCDCGSADHPRVAAARAAGIDVIVIDHHLVPAEPLPAFAFLNPHLPECGFPYKGLASCGLALSVLAGLRKNLGIPLDLRTFLDLVAIGTIADVAPLDGDNRALVRAGLAALAEAKRPGIRALAEYGKVELSQGLSAEDVAFRFAPRLNAPGRMGSPETALALLLAPSLTEARSLAAACEQKNVERRALQESMINEAMAEALASPHAGLVIAKEGFHHGIVGIVAGRIASQVGKPVIVAAIEDGAARGSVRTANGVPLVSALHLCQDLLLGYGGHEKAAGATFAVDRLDALREAFSSACERLAGTGREDPVGPSVRLCESDEMGRVVRDLRRLEPCGEGNRAPRLCLPDVRVVSARDMKGHLKLELDAGGRPLSAFGPQMGARAAELSGTRANVWGSLQFDSFRGNGAVQLMIARIDGVD
jgi:single-stranded-DNA-specific exonuclease